MSNLLSDEKLAALVQKGDEGAFATLMERYTDKLFRYGKRFISEEHIIGDIVQDVFVKVYKNIQDFDATRQFSPWIYRIAHNAFMDSIRKKSRDPFYVSDFDTIIPHPIYEDPSQRAKESEEIRVLLEKGLEKLPRAYREIIDLYYFENFDYKQIADILRIPIGTVGIRLSRARSMLKKQFPKT